MKLLFDLFPVILFFGAFKYGQANPDTVAGWMQVISSGIGPEQAPILAATLVAILASFVQVIAVYLRGKKPEPMLWISLAVIVVFGSLTIWLNNAAFIKAKPTILYWIFAAILLFGQLRGKNFIRSLLGKQLRMKDADWSTMQKMWMGFFGFAGLANLIVAWLCPTEIWVDFKLFGLMGLMFVFVLGLGIWMTKRVEQPDQDQQSEK